MTPPELQVGVDGQRGSSIRIRIQLAVQRGFLVAQMVKSLPAVQETWVPSLDWEDPLEKEVATHSSVLAWRIPWTEEPGAGRGYSSWGHKESTQLTRLTIKDPPAMQETRV